MATHLLWLLQLPVAALLLLRLLKPARRAERLGAPRRREGGPLPARAMPGWVARATGRVAAVAVVVGLVLVVASDRDGGRERPAQPPTTSPHAPETD